MKEVLNGSRMNKYLHNLKCICPSEGHASLTKNRIIWSCDKKHLPLRHQAESKIEIKLKDYQDPIDKSIDSLRDWYKTYHHESPEYCQDDCLYDQDHNLGYGRQTGVVDMCHCAVEETGLYDCHLSAALVQVSVNRTEIRRSNEVLRNTVS